MRFSSNCPPSLGLRALAWVVGATVATAFLGGRATLLAAQAAPAPTYDKLPVDPQLKSASTEIKAILSGDSPMSPQFDNYYNRYAFAQLTLPEKLNDLSTLRQDIKRQMRNAKSTEAHDRLVGLCLAMMQKIVAGNYHPAARYNAMLLLGDLNQKEPVSGRGAVPRPEVLPVMLAALADARQIDAVKLAALIGILRHAENLPTPADRAQVQQVQAAMLGIVGQKQPPAGRSAEGQAWFRGRAMDVLAALGPTSADAKLVQQLAGMTADSTETLSLRCLAARTLGRFAPAAKSMDLSALASDLGRLAADVCKQEKGAGFSRKRLRYRLYCVLAGLKGPDGKTGIAALATGPPHKDTVDAVSQPVETLLALCDDETSADQDLEIETAKVARELQTLLKATAPTPAPAPATTPATTTPPGN